MTKDRDESPQFSITLPVEALDMIDNGLKYYGLYGKKRATICRQLILDMLKTAEVQANVEAGRKRGPT